MERAEPAQAASLAFQSTLGHVLKASMTQSADSHVTSTSPSTTSGLPMRPASARLKESQLSVMMQTHLLDAVQQAIVSTDPQGVIASWNKHAEVLYGWTAAEAIGKDVAELIFAEGRSDNTAEASTEGPEPITRVQRDRQVRRKDGTVI